MSARSVWRTVAAVTACALYTVLVRRLLLDDASVSVALVQQSAALGFAVLLAALIQAMAGDALEAWSLSPQKWLAAAVSGVLHYGVTANRRITRKRKRGCTKPGTLQTALRWLNVNPMSDGGPTPTTPALPPTPYAGISS
jgi:hypothetical protein